LIKIRGARPWLGFGLAVLAAVGPLTLSRWKEKRREEEGMAAAKALGLAIAKEQGASGCVARAYQEAAYLRRGDKVALVLVYSFLDTCLGVAEDPDGWCAEHCASEPAVLDDCHEGAPHASPACTGLWLIERRACCGEADGG